MKRTPIDIAQGHVDRIKAVKAEGRAKMEREAPDVLALADELRKRFGSGVRIYRLTMYKGQ